MPAYLVVVASAMVIGVGVLASLNGDAGRQASSPAATTRTPVAAASTRPTSRPTPTPAPTPKPTLAPLAAPAIAASLAPTGVLVADTGQPAVSALVADADGTFWTTRAGGIINVDPRTGRTREWTLADDPAFADAAPAAARNGGVWLIGPDAIRLFDGSRFRAVIDTPTSLWSVVEDLDGTLWASTDAYGLIRWVDGVWSSDPPGRSSRGASDIAIDGGGRVWTADYSESEEGWWTPRGISVWDGVGWTVFALDDLPGMGDRGDSPPSLVAGADGSMWAANGRWLARFDSGAWTGLEVADLLGSDTSLDAIDQDGRLWFGSDGCQSCGVRIHVYDGSTLTTYDDGDGLPGADVLDWQWSTVALGPGYALAATAAGLYRMSDGPWQQLVLTTTTGSQATGSGPLAGVAGLAGVSRNEVWAVEYPNTDSSGLPTSGGLFRYDGGTWHREQLPVETTVGQVQLGPDGAVWVATSSGPLVRRDGSWVNLGDLVEAAVPEPSEPGHDCGGAIFVGSDGVAYYAGPRSANRVVVLTPVDGSWAATMHPTAPGDLDCWATIAATADGAVWVLVRGWGSILTRSTAWSQQTASLPGSDPVAIAVDRDGSLWVASQARDWTSDEAPLDLVVPRSDGRWESRGSAGLQSVHSIASMPDGSLIVVGNGIALVDDRGSRPILRGGWLRAVSVAPDGSVWVADSNVYRLPASSP